MVPVSLYAHASGFSWDEGLLVVAPLLVIGALLWVANRRAKRLGDGPAPDVPAAPATEHPDADHHAVDHHVE